MLAFQRLMVLECGPVLTENNQNKTPPPTEFLLEDTGESKDPPYQCPPGAVACCSCVRLTCIRLIMSSHSKATTGLGDTCVHSIGFLPSGTILLAVADGGVARTTDNGVTWSR